MEPNIHRLKREAAQWGLELTVTEGKRPTYALGYPGGHPFTSTSLVAVSSLLDRHRDALSGQRDQAA
jgi:hypothetical protein